MVSAFFETTVSLKGGGRFIIMHCTISLYSLFVTACGGEGGGGVHEGSCMVAYSCIPLYKFKHADCMYRACKLHVFLYEKAKTYNLHACTVHDLHMLFSYNLHACIHEACIYTCMYSNACM